MNLQQIIAQAGGLDAIAKQLGISQEQAGRGVDALLPAVLGGFKNSAQGAGGGALGLDSLITIAQAAGGAGLIDNVLGAGATDVGAGNGILGQIFGSKDVSRTVADHAATQTGLDPSILRKLLPIVAMLVAGYMARSGTAGGANAPSGGGLGDVLGSVLGGGAGGQGGALGGLLGGLLGGGAAAAPTGNAGGLGGLGAMLDLDGDGNPLNDIIGMAGKFTAR